MGGVFYLFIIKLRQLIAQYRPCSTLGHPRPLTCKPPGLSRFQQDRRIHTIFRKFTENRKSVLVTIDSQNSFKHYLPARCPEQHTCGHADFEQTDSLYRVRLTDSYRSIYRAGFALCPASLNIDLIHSAQYLRLF